MKTIRMFNNFVVSLVALAVLLIPTWFFLLVKHYANPQGFWQNLVLVGAGLYFVGALQVILLIVWFGLTFMIFAYHRR